MDSTRPFSGFDCEPAAAGCSLSQPTLTFVPFSFGFFSLLAVVLLSLSSGWTAGTLGASRKKDGKFKAFGKLDRPLRFLVLTVAFRHVGAMVPNSAVERERASRCAETMLGPSKLVRPQTRATCQKLLAGFQNWLYTEHGVQLSVLLSAKPPDPEEICK